MNLCVDVGNSTIVLGVFQENELVQKLIVTTDLRKTEDEFYGDIKQQVFLHNIKHEGIKKIIFSSVVPTLNTALKNALKRFFKCDVLVIGPGIKTGLSINVDNPSEIGNDLIADLVGAKDKYGYPCLIADLGTASKILVLDKNGTFVSCVILAGISMGAESLAKNTALLPQISLEVPKTILAKNTVEAMNSGLVYGHADMIDGLCKRYEKELGYPCKKVLTGGHAYHVGHVLTEGYIIDQNVNLFGLNLILEKNTYEK